MKAFIKKHAIANSDSKTVQEQFRKFSRRPDGSLKKYSYYKMWRPEDLREKKENRSKNEIVRVVREVGVNKIITAMCDCLILRLSSRYDYIDWVFTGDSKHDVKKNGKMIKNDIPYQAYFFKIMTDYLFG
eukprot:scaffold33223_cov38-Cyclotella_meneghiniana.AAC.6